MQHNQLTLHIAPDVLATVLDADLYVVIARQRKASTSPVLAWVAFSPLQQNVITWTEAYSLYASTTELKTGNTLMVQALQADALPGKVYPFDRHGSFTSPSGSVPAGQYGIANTYPHAQAMTFGLAQTVVLSGNGQEASPVTAASVLQDQTVTFVPPDGLLIFLTRAVEPGSVLGSQSSLQANVAEYPVEAAQKGLVLHYSLDSGRFEP